MNQPHHLPFPLLGNWCLLFLLCLCASPSWATDDEIPLPDDLPSDESDVPALSPTEVTKDGKFIAPPRYLGNQAPAPPQAAPQSAPAQPSAPAPVASPQPAVTQVPAPNDNLSEPTPIPAEDSSETTGPSSVPFDDDTSSTEEPAENTDDATTELLPSDASDEVSQSQPTDFVSPASPEPQPDRTYTSISGSKQFVVRGKDPSLTSALSVKCDDIRKGLLDLLKLPREWKNNIDVNLFGKSGAPTPIRPIRMGINVIEDSPHYYINLHIGRGIDIEDLNRAVTTMLLYELMLRDIDPNGLPENIELPPWLLTGIEQAIQWKTGHPDRELYATLFDRGEIFSPQQVLNAKNPQEEFDATTYAAYKASCGSLILCLLNQKGGEEAMMRVLNEAILGADQPENLVARNFPLLSLTPTSLHKWWSLQLSTMATPEMTEALTLATSEKRLVEALSFLKYDPETKVSSTVDIADLDTLLALPDAKPQLNISLNNLVYLSNRCFPTYRGIITGYARIIARLIADKYVKDDIQKKLEELSEMRRLSMLAATRTRDYLDWYEINTSHNPSNTFASYMRAMQILRMPNQSTTTPITRYLRDIEQLYLLPAQAPTPELAPETSTQNPSQN